MQGFALLFVDSAVHNLSYSVLPRSDQLVVDLVRLVEVEVQREYPLVVVTHGGREEVDLRIDQLDHALQTFGIKTEQIVPQVEVCFINQDDGISGNILEIGRTDTLDHVVGDRVLAEILLKL